MKKLFVISYSLLLVFILLSCGGQKKTPENQTVVPQINQSGESSSIQQDSAKTDSKVSKPNTRDMKGSEIIGLAMESLTRKINLTENQISSIKEILSRSFNELGDNMNKSYTFEERKEIGKGLVNKSRSEINNLLQPDQQALFEKFGQK